MVNVQDTVPAPLNYAPPGYSPYPKSICTSVNHQICHGVPGPKKLKNGDIINIPSYQVSPGDVVSVRSKAKEQLRIKSALELAAQRSPIEWINVNNEKLEGLFSRKPDRADLSPDINENLIVELYSK